MKLLKGALATVLAILMIACSTQSSKQEEKESKKKEPIKILVSMGAPSLSLLGLCSDQDITINTVDEMGVLCTQLAKKNGKYDVTITPINLGTALFSKDKSTYLLDSVVTRGNLYTIGNDEAGLQKERIFTAFDEKAVPQKVLEGSTDLSLLTPEIRCFNSANKVQVQLLSKKAAVGLLAESAATATIARAKEKGIGPKVLKDLQKEYRVANNMEQSGYPQTALLIKKGSEGKAAAYRKEVEAFMKRADDTSIVGATGAATVEKLGISNVQIVQKTWKRRNIRFEKATDTQKDIALSLKQFIIALRDSAYTR